MSALSKLDFLVMKFTAGLQGAEGRIIRFRAYVMAIASAAAAFEIILPPPCVVLLFEPTQRPPPAKRFVARGSEPPARQAECSGKRGLSGYERGCGGRHPPPATQKS
jgi:hypothetical protein